MFRRPIQRYGLTPEPATPYQRAAQVWDDRIGSARVQAKNWRMMSFGGLGLALCFGGALAWQSVQSRVTPYVVQVDKFGAVQAVLRIRVSQLSATVGAGFAATATLAL